MACCFFVVFRTVYPNHNLKAFLENLGFTIFLWGFAGICASLLWAGAIPRHAFLSRAFASPPTFPADLETRRPVRVLVGSSDPARFP